MPVTHHPRKYCDDFMCADRTLRTSILRPGDPEPVDRTWLNGAVWILTCTAPTVL